MRSSSRYAIPPAAIPYRADVEHVDPDEAETITALSKAMGEVTAHVQDKRGYAMRATHAKATGFLKGELVILDDLPTELAQGMFARPGRHDTLVRFSQGPSEPLSDRASGQRGMAIKVLGVQGPHVPESRETTTQDWVLAVGVAFNNRTAQSFARTFALGAGRSTWVPEPLIVAGSCAARAVEAAWEVVGSGSANLRFFGRPPRHPVGDAYYSQAAVRYGDHIAKIAVVPTTETLARIGDPRVDLRHDRNSFRDATVTYFTDHQATYDLKVQLCTDLERMPVEDAAVPWPEDASPYRPVARLTLPVQAAYSPDRRHYFDERLSFNPWHALDSHRPLGSVMRARLQPYLVAQDARQQGNRVTPAEPSSHADVPD